MDGKEKIIEFYGDPIAEGIDISNYPEVIPGFTYRMLAGIYRGHHYVELLMFPIEMAEENMKRRMLEMFQSWIDTLVIPEFYRDGPIPENYIKIGQENIEFNKQPFEGSQKLEVITSGGKQFNIYVRRNRLYPGESNEKGN